MQEILNGYLLFGKHLKFMISDIQNAVRCKKKEYLYLVMIQKQIKKTNYWCWHPRPESDGHHCQPALHHHGYQSAHHRRHLSL